MNKIESSNSIYIGLMKIGSKNNILDSYCNNYLYFNTIEHFRSIENSQMGRHDPHEGDLLIKQVVKLTVEKDGIKYNFHEIFKKFNSQYHESLTRVPGNICSFCLFALKQDINEFSIDQRLKELADTALVITDFSKFVKSVDKSINQLGFKFARKQVEYYDPKTYAGDLSFFHKDKYFQYQNEYRILIQSNGEEPIKLPIPNLKKVSQLLDFVSLKKLILEIKDTL